MDGRGTDGICRIVSISSRRELPRSTCSQERTGEAVDSHTTCRVRADRGRSLDFGLPATMSGKPYSLDAKVLEEARIASVGRHLVLKSLEHNPELCFEVLGLLSREVQQLRDRL
jgi:hypothetical protein